MKAIVKAVLGPSMGDMADNAVAFMEERARMNPTTPRPILSPEAAEVLRWIARGRPTPTPDCIRNAPSEEELTRRIMHEFLLKDLAYSDGTLSDKGLQEAARLQEEAADEKAKEATPPTFVLRSIHPEDDRPRYLALSSDRTSKGVIIGWSPFWSVDPAMAFPFEARRDAACAQAQYGAGCSETEGALFDNALILLSRLMRARKIDTLDDLERAVIAEENRT